MQPIKDPQMTPMHQCRIQDRGTTLIFLDHKGQIQVDLPSLSPTPDPLNHQITHQVSAMIKGLTR